MTATRGTTHTALLTAATAGWPTTLRYALLLLITRGTIGAAVLLLLR
ncbi:hypothetical protein [Amycolatopsis sp. DSM 110486]|nr:hypothetical protein [Amycolatopsis sp. DSM 110486]QYN22884.1 hypothetical protein K1T34_10695 [Amycolatopsis sp. DSM 110486]